MNKKLTTEDEKIEGILIDFHFTKLGLTIQAKTYPEALEQAQKLSNLK